MATTDEMGTTYLGTLFAYWYLEVQSNDLSSVCIESNSVNRNKE